MMFRIGGIINRPGQWIVWITGLDDKSYSGTFGQAQMATGFAMRPTASSMALLRFWRGPEVDEAGAAVDNATYEYPSARWRKPL